MFLWAPALALALWWPASWAGPQASWPETLKRLKGMHSKGAFAAAYDQGVFQRARQRALPAASWTLEAQKGKFLLKRPGELLAFDGATMVAVNHEARMVTKAAGKPELFGDLAPLLAGGELLGEFEPSPWDPQAPVPGLTREEQEFLTAGVGKETQGLMTASLRRKRSEGKGDRVFYVTFPATGPLHMDSLRFAGEGNITRLRFSSWKWTEGFPPAQFSCTPPPGYHVSTVP